MASHRKPRPGGTPGAGIGTPALATAALTSVAVLSQSAGAAPAAGHAVPSPEEVERKIDDLYRRAESAAEAATAGKERGGRADRGNARDRGAGRERADVRTEARVGAPARAAGRAEGWAGAPEQRPEWGQDRTGRDERMGADGGGASGRRADSLQRLRDEVARRAQHRALPSLRGKIPAQRGTGPTGGRAATPTPGDVATAPSVGSTDLSSAGRGMGTAPSAAMGAGTTAPSVRGSGIPASPVTGAGMAPSPAMGAGTAAPSVTGAGIAPSPARDAGTAASAGDTGVAATSPGTGARHARAPRSASPVRNAGIAQPAGDTEIGRTGRETGPASPFGDTGAGPLVQSVPDTAVAPPVHETGPVQPVPDTVVATPARDTTVFPPLAQGGPGAVGREPAATSFTGAATATATPAPAAVSASAAVSFSASASASAMAVPQAAASAAGLTDTVASGPKAAKAAVQKKLAHARVLLKQQAMQAAAAPSGTYATKARKAIAFARAQLGKPCVWGAAGPGSYDCSGLTQAAWKSAGVTLPRTAREQAEAGTRIVPADARPGDLVFFHDDVSHVGLCTGDGMMIHAPRPGAYVREEPVSGFGDSAVRTVVRPG